MTFPDTPLDVRAEVQLNGAWTDLSSRLDHGPVSIGRGHPDESTAVSTSTLAMILTNGDGALTSKNPVSPYYPYLKRNVPCRVSIPAQSAYLRLETDRASNASCPDAAGLHVTGDIDIRADMRLTNGIGGTLAAKWVIGAGGGGQNCWLLRVNGDSTLQLFWSTTGSDFPSATSAMPLPAPGRQSVRVTLAVATGTVTFYTGPAGGADGSTWTQLGAAIVTGTTSIFAGTTAMTAGNAVGGSASGWTGNLYELEVRSGIGGTVVAHPVFSVQTAGATSFTDAQGNTWTMSGTAEISNRLYLGHFEAAGWPQQQPAAGSNFLVPVSGGGLLRRLGRESTPLNSVMYRAYTRITSTAAPVAYWPMEDGAGSSQLGAAIGGLPMYFSGPAQLASSSAFACSAPLPVTNGAAFTATVPRAASWTDNVMRFLMSVPSGGEADGSLIAQFSTAGTVATAALRYGTGGSLTLTGWDQSGAQLFTTGAAGFAVNGQNLRVSANLKASGGNVAYQIETLAPGSSSASVFGGTLTGAAVGAVTRVQLNPGGSLTQTALGHCSVQAVWDSLADVAQALNAWTGEPAGTRLGRLCGEEGIQFRSRGVLNNTALMGPQTTQTLTALLQECADADRGVWYELAQQLGWGYITRAALYNQSPGVTVTWQQDNLSLWDSDPTEDDLPLVNDITLSNSATGATVRQYAAPGQPVSGGRLSSLPSSQGGVGTYDSAPVTSVNLWRDSDLASTASWMIWLGTADQPRFPGIVLDLTNRVLAPLFWPILGLELGDVLEMDALPVQLPPDPVRQLIQQLNLTVWHKTLTIGVTGVPESPYEVAAAAAYPHAAGTPSKADTAGSQLAASAAAGNVPAGWGGPAGWAGWGGTNATAAVSGGQLVITSTSAAAGAGFWQGFGPAQAVTAGQTVAVVATVTVPQALGAVAVGIHLSGGSDTFTSSAPAAVAAGQTVTLCATATAAAGQTGWQVYLIDSEGSAAGLVMDAVLAYGAVAGTLSVAVTAGNLWITTAAFASQFPLDIGVAGERVTVCGITGSSSPQSFTVIRAVNGISKSQASGTPVSLWSPPAAAL